MPIGSAVQDRDRVIVYNEHGAMLGAHAGILKEFTKGWVAVTQSDRIHVFDEFGGTLRMVNIDGWDKGGRP